MPPPCPQPAAAGDFDKARSMIQAGYATAAAWIARGGLAEHEVPGALRPHRH